jgi:hypothetical protein
MELRGQVVRRMFGLGSKSEHEAVMFDTALGSFRLRRIQGNAFRDPELDPLVGRAILAEGTIHGKTFLLKSWKIVDNEGKPADQ